MPPSRSLQSLPLFPLRTVLFPGGLLPLKVFEHRYVEMTKACLRDGQPFGVCLITRGEEVARGDGAVPEFATIGTLARITDFDMPQLGMPRDLNFEDGIDGFDHADDYVILPVTVRLAWRGVSGDSRQEYHTVLTR